MRVRHHEQWRVAGVMIIISKASGLTTDIRKCEDLQDCERSHDNHESNKCDRNISEQTATLNIYI